MHGTSTPLWGRAPKHEVVTDQELLQRIQEGDPLAFPQFYAQYAPLVYKYIRFRVANDQDADEITATVFVKAWQALPRYKWRGVPLTAWLFRIAYNEIVDSHRKQRGFSFMQWLPWKTEAREDAYEQIEQRDVIHRAWDTLSFEQQTIIYLAFFEGYSNQEIAELLDKSANAVGVIKFRALKELGKVITHG
jgi:RNA polymerase sigma-70 factor (ECF subfamily)